MHAFHFRPFWIIATAMPPLTQLPITSSAKERDHSVRRSFVRMQNHCHELDYGCRQNLPAGWLVGVDQASGETYYYNGETGQSQWQSPLPNSAPLLWRVDGVRGVERFPGDTDAVRMIKMLDEDDWEWEDDYELPYNLRNGEEQMLGRRNMIYSKLTVSRVQAVVQVASDGTATLESRGKGPTLWRERGDPLWWALQRGERAPLADGDEMSLDVNDPEAAVFTCWRERAVQPQDGYLSQWENSYPQQGGIY